MSFKKLKNSINYMSNFSGDSGDSSSPRLLNNSNLPAIDQEETPIDPHQVSLYLKILDIQSQFATRRWTITTFFIGLSFAILGFSIPLFRVENSNRYIISTRCITAGIVYWFAYFLSASLYIYSKSLRDYLEKLEQSNDSKRVPFDFQSKTKVYMKNQRTKGIFTLPTTTKLLKYFGFVYSLIILLILIFGWGLN